VVILLLKVEENTFKTNASRCAILVGLTNLSFCTTLLARRNTQIGSTDFNDTPSLLSIAVSLSLFVPSTTWGTIMPQISAADTLLNSSDQEYEPAVKPHFRAGLKSIESMHKSRREDRFTSKKRLRTLENVRGAPGTVYHRALWLNRLENYAHSIELV
jgi:hypothetical protein